MSESNSELEFPPISVGHSFSTDESSYTVESILGQGCYGQVAKCTRHADGRSVAVKFIQNSLYMKISAENEVEIMNTIRQLTVPESHIIQMNRTFSYFGYTCLEFELLDQNLRELMMEQKKPLELDVIREILRQLALALSHLGSLGIIHNDIKLDNVMLDRKSLPFTVKLIDFGLAQKVTDVTPGRCFQPRWFRSPEVLLGAPYHTAIDMWSLGCMTMCLCTGNFLYKEENHYEMVRQIEQLQGALAQCVRESGKYTKRYYMEDGKTLKTPEQYYREIQKTRHERERFVGSLEQYLMMKCSQRAHNPEELQHFVDLVKRMLHVDPCRRITPLQVLQHPFITGPVHSVKLAREALTLVLRLKDVEADNCSAPPKSKSSEVQADSGRNKKRQRSPSPPRTMAKIQKLSIPTMADKKKRKRPQSGQRRSPSAGDQKPIHQTAKRAKVTSKRPRSPSNVGVSPESRKQPQRKRQRAKPQSGTTCCIRRTTTTMNDQHVETQMTRRFPDRDRNRPTTTTSNSNPLSS